MKQIRQLFEHVLAEGVRKSNRTGVDTIGVFGYQMRFDLREGFPICTQKFVPFRLVAAELLWFIEGACHQPGSIAGLHANNCTIWDEWVKADGSFGPIYGTQWRHWRGVDDASGEIVEVDQLKAMIEDLRHNPSSRRNIVSAWQPAELKSMALPPCHVMFQLNCEPRPEGGYFVDLQMYQRSCDVFLGVPFNVSSYALLLELLCHVSHTTSSPRIPRHLVWTGGDVHMYENHEQAVRQYLANPAHPLPTLVIDNDTIDIDAIALKDLRLVGYEHSGKIAAEVAV